MTPHAQPLHAARGGFSALGVSVLGVVCAVPERTVENDVMVARFGAQAVADVAKMVGVEARHWARADQTAGDLCETAAHVLLERLGWEAESVDALIFVSQTPDYRLPATACVLHGKLGLDPVCQAFDVNLGCSGYVYGLWLSASLLQSGCSRILLLAGDTISKIVDPSDRATAMLFGDAGSATALERSDAAPPIHFRLGTDGKGATSLIVPQGAFRDGEAKEGLDPRRLYMDGNQVFSFSLRAIPKLVSETLADANLSADSVDYYLFHQANRFMLRHIGKKIGVGEDRIPVNIDRYGNTSSATIPLLIATDLAKRAAAERLEVMMVGFGVGLSWASALTALGPLEVAKLVTI